MQGLPGSWSLRKSYCKEHSIFCGNEDTGGCDGNYEQCECIEKAIWRLQGETDSFGAEYHYYCEEHMKDLQKKKHDWYNSSEAEELVKCDWCDKQVQAKMIRPHRDFEEGSASPIYDVCTTCIRKESEALAAEVEEYDPYDNMPDPDYEAYLEKQAEKKSTVYIIKYTRRFQVCASGLTNMKMTIPQNKWNTFQKDYSKFYRDKDYPLELKECPDMSIEAFSTQYSMYIK